MRKRACKGCISKVGMVSGSQAATLTESMCEFAKTSTYADTLCISKSVSSGSCSNSNGGT